MRKLTVLMIGVAVLALGGMTVQAAETTTTEIESPDGTTTTVIAPGAATPPATPGAVQTTTGTTVVVDPPVAIDAITGKPVSNTTAEPKKEKESLRDKVRDKME